MNLLYIDLFCGAGGTTTGICQVPGVHVVACVNHDADAIASHAANHRESLRVMGFPEDYKLCGTQTAQRKFIGNAVEVNMARHMAQALVDSLSGVVEVHGDQMSFEFRKAAI